MPNPILPPDVDRPGPARWVPGAPAVLPVSVRGMSPWLHQPQVTFELEGAPAGVWVPHAVDPAKLEYAGVLIAEVKLPKDVAWVVSRYPGAPDNSSALKPVTPFAPPAKVSKVASQRVGAQITLSARVTGVPLGGATLLAAPFAPNLPKQQDAAAYAALGATVALKAGDHEVVKWSLTAGAVDRYALVVVRSFPKATEILSAPVVVAV